MQANVPFLYNARFVRKGDRKEKNWQVLSSEQMVIPETKNVRLAGRYVYRNNLKTDYLATDYGLVKTMRLFEDKTYYATTLANLIVPLHANDLQTKLNEWRDMVAVRVNWPWNITVKIPFCAGLDFKEGNIIREEDAPLGVDQNNKQQALDRLREAVRYSAIVDGIVYERSGGPFWTVYTVRGRHPTVQIHVNQEIFRKSFLDLQERKYSEFFNADQRQECFDLFNANSATYLHKEAVAEPCNRLQIFHPEVFANGYYKKRRMDGNFEWAVQNFMEQASASLYRMSGDEIREFALLKDRFILAQNNPSEQQENSLIDQAFVVNSLIARFDDSFGRVGINHPLNGLVQVATEKNSESEVVLGDEELDCLENSVFKP